jgi:hypothetical protein
MRMKNERRPAGTTSFKGRPTNKQTNKQHDITIQATQKQDRIG